MIRHRMRCFTLALLLLCSVAALGSPAPVVYTLGAPLGQVAAIDVDHSGRLLVMDYSRQAVLRFDIDGQLDKLWPYDDSLQTYNYPTAASISVRRDGKIYVTPGYAGGGKVPVRLLDIDARTCTAIEGTKWWHGVLATKKDDGFYAVMRVTGRGSAHDSCVQAYSADGRPGKRWDAPTKWRGIAVGEDGNIYIRTDENKWEVFNPQGKLLRALDIEAMVPSEKLFCRDIAFDRNGDIYASCVVVGKNGFEDAIARISKEGKLLRMIPGPEQTSTWPLRHYGSVVVRNGLVFTTVSMGNENANCEIRAFTPGGQCVARYVSPTPDINLPGAIAVQKDGSCAVQQLGCGNILLLDPELKPYGKITESNCGNVLAGPDGGYYVVNGSRLDLYDKTGKQTKLLLKDSQKPDGFLKDNVSHAACDSNGHVWANSHEHPINQLVEFGEDGSLLRRIPTGKEFIPGEMAMDTKGQIYCNLRPDPGFLAFIPDPESIVAVYDLDGKRLRTIGKTGSGIGELKGNNGMVLDESGRLYVADTGNSRVQVFTSMGEALGVWTGPADKRLNHPLGVAIGPNQTLWATDTYNNRIVRVSLEDFWKQISMTVSEPVLQIEVKAPAPAAGKTIASGIVIAGTDDFTDSVYLESADRAWGVCAKLPANTVLARGERCKLGGSFDAGSRILTAEPLERFGKTRTPAPLGMANLYVGDGYQSDKRRALSNRCLLVRTWGRVVSVDTEEQIFVINDGSITGDNAGLTVYFGSLRKPVAELPSVGRYVVITGISTSWVDTGNRHIPAVRIRDGADIQVLAGD